MIRCSATQLYIMGTLRVVSSFGRPRDKPMFISFHNSLSPPGETGHSSKSLRSVFLFSGESNQMPQYGRHGHRSHGVAMLLAM